MKYEASVSDEMIKLGVTVLMDSMNKPSNERVKAIFLAMYKQMYFEVQAKEDQKWLEQWDTAYARDFKYGHDDVNNFMDRV